MCELGALKEIFDAGSCRFRSYSDLLQSEHQYSRIYPTYVGLSFYASPNEKAIVLSDTLRKCYNWINGSALKGFLAPVSAARVYHREALISRTASDLLTELRRHSP